MKALPAEPEMGRDDALDAFLAVANAVEPDHPYLDDPYPLSRENVKFGTTRSYYGRCGPRRRGRIKVYYATRMTYVNEISRERHLALITHEITHIPINGENHSSCHGKAFWREMAFHALLVRDSLTDGTLAKVFPDANVEKYLREVVEDVNPSIVDRRQMTVDETKELLADLLSVGI